MRYSIQLRDPIFVRGYRFLYFARNIGKNIGKSISKNISSKYDLKFLDHAKQSAQIHLTLFMIGILGAAHGWGRGVAKKAPSLKSVTHILQ